MSPKGRKEIMKEIIIVTGLGIGEESKGATVEWLSKELKAHTVLRSGGCQAGHNIVQDKREQKFSHFGCGTFEGAKTHLIDMVFDPIELFEEAIELEEKGVKDPLEMISIDEDCVAITPFHGAISRLREILRDNDKKGTIGKGVGEALRDSCDPNLVIRAKDFFEDEEVLIYKVENIRKYKLEQALLLLTGSEIVPQEIEILRNERLTKEIVSSFKYLSMLVKITGKKYLKELLDREGVMVGEASHGALLHPDYGFVPHVTQVDPTARKVLEAISTNEYNGRIYRIGLSRTYMTRHGAGPLVSFNEEMTSSIKETHNDKDHEWLGVFRNGNYDVVAMKYAIEISGGKKSFDGLKISFMDVLSNFDKWEICEAYRYDGNEADLNDYFEIKDGLIREIKVYRGKNKDDQLEHQLQLTKLLKACKPVLRSICATEEKDLGQVFIEYVEEKLELPVIALAFGPKSSDRKFRINLSEIG